MAEQFYFAWVNEGVTFNPAVHNVFDENVFSFSLDQAEGDFAALSAVIKNPRIGLLNTGRKVWAFLSFNKGTDASPDIVCLFHGRLIGVPTNIFDTVVTLEFTARPPDFIDQKTTLADSMRELPYYDPIFISPNSWDDPDAVLEAYSKLWHIDPVTLVVTVSDIIIPEDGTVEVTEDEHFYDEMQVTLSQTPLRRVSMTATIPWTQTAAAEGLSLTARIKGLFGTPIPTSYTMPGLIQSWPNPGSDFGSGWKVTSGSMVDVSGTIDKVALPDFFSWQGVVPDIPEGSIVFPIKETGTIDLFKVDAAASFDLTYEVVIAALGYAVPELTVDYAANREFAQTVTFTLETDQQSIVTLPGTDEALLITLNANKVSDPSVDGVVPILDVRRRDYVHTDRGMLSLEYLLLVARAHLIARSRAVETTFKMPFKTALPLQSLRKSALLHDHRLPGGVATGKITHYSFTLDGDQGEAIAEIKIASTIGYGGSYSASDGTPAYVALGYVATPYQEYTGQVVLTDTADIQWTVPTAANFDDGLDFVRGLTDATAVIAATITNNAASQAVAINAISAGANTDQAAVASLLQTIPTKLSFQMVPMEGGPFTHEIVLSVADLIVPQQINLEAPSNA